MKTGSLLTLLMGAMVAPSAAFAPSFGVAKTSSTTALGMANDKDLMRWARSSRSASADDRVVELKRPLGLILDEDDSGNVYVDTVAPRGNAARTGIVRV